MAKSQRTEKMNLKETAVIKFLLSLILAALISSCSEKYETPDACVNAFIKSAVEHDMKKAWSTLAPEARDFYNDLGNKNRKSGRGILEHDISEIKKFRKYNEDYRIETGEGNPNKIILTTLKNDSLIIETIIEDGSYKIRDAESVRNLIKGIAAEIVRKDYY